MTEVARLNAPRSQAIMSVAGRVGTVLLGCNADLARV